MFDFKPDNTPSAALRRMLLLLIAALVLACGIAARADSVRLYDQTGVEGVNVTLADVAELTGPHATALGQTQIATIKAGEQEIKVSLDDVESALDKAGVNWGLVSLRGYSACRVARLAPPPIITIGRGQAVAANIETPIDLDAELTLRARVEQLVAERSGLQRDELRITFTDRDGAKLDRPALGQSIEIEPTSLNTLGRVPMIIRLYESGRVSQTLTVRAHVKRVLLAVVTTGPIARGEVFTRSHLAVRECYLDDDDVTPITDPMIAVGQEATASMGGGEILFARKVKAPIMVKRGELVTVRCLIGSLVVRTVGKAAENGSIDDAIQVRAESTGKTFSAVVTGRGEAVMPGPALDGQRRASTWGTQQQGAMK